MAKKDDIPFINFLSDHGLIPVSNDRFKLRAGSSFGNNGTVYYNNVAYEFDDYTGTLKTVGGDPSWQTPIGIGWQQGYDPNTVYLGSQPYNIDDLLDGSAWKEMGISASQMGFQIDETTDLPNEDNPEVKSQLREFIGSLPSDLWEFSKEVVKNSGKDIAQYLLARGFAKWLTGDQQQAVEDLRSQMQNRIDLVEEQDRINRERRDELAGTIHSRMLNRLNDPDPLSGIPRPQRLPSFNPNIQRFNTRDGQGGHVGSLADATMYRYAPSFLAPQDPNVDPFSTESIRDFSDRATSPWASGRPWRSAKPWENDPNFDPDAGNGSDTVGNSANQSVSQRDSYNQGREFQRDEWTDRGLDIMRGQRKQPSFGWRDKEGNITEYTGDGVIGDEYMKYLRQVQERNANLPPDRRISALSPQDLEAQQLAMTTGASFGTAFNEPPLERKSGEDLIASYGSDGFPYSGSVAQQQMGDWEWWKQGKPDYSPYYKTIDDVEWGNPIYEDTNSDQSQEARRKYANYARESVRKNPNAWHESFRPSQEWLEWQRLNDKYGNLTKGQAIRARLDSKRSATNYNKWAERRMDNDPERRGRVGN